MEENRYLTISEFTSRLKNVFDSSKLFQNMYLKGEISNFKRHTTGHLYFSIKDENSVINAMMWARDAANLNFNPVDGTKVLVHGRITVYEARGTYQIYVDNMIEDGIGEKPKNEEETSIIEMIEVKHEQTKNDDSSSDNSKLPSFD